MEREKVKKLSEEDQLNERKRFVYVYNENWAKFVDGERRVNLISLSFSPRKREVIDYMSGEHRAELRYGNLNVYFEQTFFYQRVPEYPVMFFKEKRQIRESEKMPRALRRYIGKRLYVSTTVYPLSSSEDGETRVVSKERYYASTKITHPIAESWTAERFTPPGFTGKTNPKKEKTEKPIPQERALIAYIPREPRMVWKRSK